MNKYMKLHPVQIEDFLNNPPESISATDLEAIKRNARLVEGYTFLYNSRGEKIRGFLITPKGSKNLPCVIFCRGGHGDTMGAIQIHRMYTFLAEIAKLGYAVLATQYAGNGGGTGREDMGENDAEDILQLVCATAGLAYIDGSRVALLGQSRGSLGVCSALKRSNSPRIAIIKSGLYDIEDQFTYRSTMKDNVHSLYYDVDDIVEVQTRSPVCFVDKINKDSNILIIHGEEDDRVKIREAQKMHTLLQKEGVNSKLRIYQDTGHIIHHSHTQLIDDIKGWLSIYL